MLLSRRRELGLSAGQASQILKLREDVLIAFEEGDWDRIPQSGYAQGMLSSYARYLGLNAREIVDLFQEELFEHQHGSSSHALRRRTRDTQMGRGISGYDMVNEAGSRPKAYVQYRPLLPTSGGPAGDMGDFATTTPARSRSSVALAGSGLGYGSSRSSFQETQKLHPTPESYEPRRRYNDDSRTERTQPSTARRRSQASRRRADDPAGRLLSEGQYAPGRGEWRRDDVSTRRVRPSEYTDDLRYDDRATSFAPASTISGRRSSRNIAPVERPNVRRRSGSVSSGRGTGRGRRPAGRGGVVGAVAGFFSDPRRALLVLIVLLAAALTAIIVFGVSSCVRTPASTSGGQTVQVNNAQGQDAGTPQGSTSQEPAGGSDQNADSGDDGEAETDANADADANVDAGTDAGTDEGTDGDAAADAEPEETIVEVSLASGTSAWVEITCDGESVVADTLVGPWSASYNVHDAITIQTPSSDAVTVTENGTRVPFTSKVGGMGTLTIEGTPLPEETESADAADGAQTTTTNTGTGA